MGLGDALSGLHSSFHHYATRKEQSQGSPMQQLRHGGPLRINILLNIEAEGIRDKLNSLAEQLGRGGYSFHDLKGVEGNLYAISASKGGEDFRGEIDRVNRIIDSVMPVEEKFNESNLDKLQAILYSDTPLNKSELEAVNSRLEKLALYYGGIETRDAADKLQGVAEMQIYVCKKIDALEKGQGEVGLADIANVPDESMAEASFSSFLREREQDFEVKEAPYETRRKENREKLEGAKEELEKAFQPSEFNYGQNISEIMEGVHQLLSSTKESFDPSSSEECEGAGRLLEGGIVYQFDCDQKRDGIIFTVASGGALIYSQDEGERRSPEKIVPKLKRALSDRGIDGELHKIIQFNLTQSTTAYKNVALESILGVYLSQRFDGESERPYLYLGGRTSSANFEIDGEGGVTVTMVRDTPIYDRGKGEGNNLYNLVSTTQYKLQRDPKSGLYSLKNPEEYHIAYALRIEKQSIILFEN